MNAASISRALKRDVGIRTGQTVDHAYKVVGTAIWVTASDVEPINAAPLDSAEDLRDCGWEVRHAEGEGVIQVESVPSARKAS